MKIKNLRVKSQLSIGFGIILILVLLLGVVVYFQTTAIVNQAETMYEHPFKVSKAIEQLNADILNMQVHLRDLVLIDTVNQDELNELFAQSDADIHVQFDILRELYLGPKQDVEAAYNAYIDWKTSTLKITDNVFSGDLETAKKSLLPGEMVATSRETLLAKIDVIRSFANNKADSLYLNTNNLYTTIKLQVSLFIFLCVAFSSGIGFILIRNLQEPIDELTRATDEFHNGNQNARSRYRYSNEFGILSESFNELAGDIQKNMELSEKSENFIKVMVGEEDVREFFKKTLNLLLINTDSQVGAVYLLDYQNNQFEYFESIGLDENGRKSFDYDTLEGEFGASIASGRYRLIRDIPADSRFTFYTVYGKFIPREIISIPIIFGEKVIAMISLAAISKYAQKSIDFIEATVNTMSARIEGILAYRTIKEFSEKMEIQNRELDAQKNEMEEQSVELMHQNIELEMQKKELKEANQLKTNFLSNMSHELRTPLNSVIALSGILNRRLRNAIPEEEYSYLEVIERNGKNLLALINDILDISRIEAGREEVDITTFNVNLLINDVVEMLAPQANQKDVLCVNTSKGTSVYINSDSDKCRHILENLAGNAVKFTEKGKVELSLNQDQENIEIRVKDTGIGIDKNYLPFVFEEFRQADGSTSRKFGGTGLGLAIAKKYANLLGGTIRVKSQVGQGSEFILSLPINYSIENRVHEEIPVKKAETFKFKTDEGRGHLANKQLIEPSTKTLLLVEDSEPAVIQIRDLLAESGYTIRVARDAEEAFKIIEEVIPDAMILDLMMPGIDGFELLGVLREAEATAEIPVLILTAKHISKDELKFLTRNNIHQLIQKGDINREDLKQAVASMLYPEVKEKNIKQFEAETNQRKPLVLAVEDNPDNMITVKALLEDHFSVLEAVDGNEGIEMAKQFVPDLILMDIALPGINGIQAFKTIRALPALHKIPVIALTASAMTQDREGILAQGFDAFIPKPIIEREFLKVIREVLYDR
ncbi:response regulator [Acetobacterium woodii]|uniref:Stage 0 sporulation protein A homolog n=1 Tax=Acetobacterium woodii (strain ATCC 29683 / DSM 1030 / JCM 2381 / KCTC 1655 / WB1) TaxID=931626 RepID=H6LJ21_ACEWD|nr:response regulator [Acetobacterium woodii]AFA47384.1 sensor histidine kinase [Acetobacterium woodii DSM 1030]